MAVCYTGPRNISENFGHVWSVADFENKMKNSKTGDLIQSDIFHIGDTKWQLVIFPNGIEGHEKIILVALIQMSKKTVTVSWDLFTGKKSTGQFVKMARGSRAKMEREVWEAVVVSHEEINTLPILKDGIFELISNIAVKGPAAETSVELSLIHI